MRLPRHFHDEADSHAGVLVRAAEGINDVELLIRQLLNRQILHGRPSGLGHRMVVVLVALARPPYGVLGVLVHDDILVLGAAAGINAGHDVHSAQFGHLTLFIALVGGLGFFFEQQIVRRIVHNLGRAGNAILAQIQLCHVEPTSFFKLVGQYTADSGKIPILHIYIIHHLRGKIKMYFGKFSANSLTLDAFCLKTRNKVARRGQGGDRGLRPFSLPPCRVRRREISENTTRSGAIPRWIRP